MINDHFSAEFGIPEDRVLNKKKMKLDQWMMDFIERSPFLVISSCDINGRCTSSPRGGKEGFVKVVDTTTLIIPDYRGNRLFETSRNLSQNESIGILFLIPGFSTTLRISGQADVVSAQELYLAKDFSDEKILQCFRIVVSEAYYHCGRAINLSKLWDTERISRNSTNPPITKRPNNRNMT